MIYKFGEQLVPVTTEEWETDQVPAVFVTDSRHADETLAKAGIIYENEIQVAKIGFCRLENQQDCGGRNSLHPQAAGCTGEQISDVFLRQPQ